MGGEEQGKVPVASQGKAGGGVVWNHGCHGCMKNNGSTSMKGPEEVFTTASPVQKGEEEKQRNPVQKNTRQEKRREEGRKKQRKMENGIGSLNYR